MAVPTSVVHLVVHVAPGSNSHGPPLPPGVGGVAMPPPVAPPLVKPPPEAPARMAMEDREFASKSMATIVCDVDRAQRFCAQSEATLQIVNLMRQSSERRQGEAVAECQDAAAACRIVMEAMAQMNKAAAAAIVAKQNKAPAVPERNKAPAVAKLNKAPAVPERNKAPAVAKVNKAPAVPKPPAGKAVAKPEPGGKAAVPVPRRPPPCRATGERRNGRSRSR